MQTGKEVVEDDDVYSVVTGETILQAIRQNEHPGNNFEIIGSVVELPGPNNFLFYGPGESVDTIYEYCSTVYGRDHPHSNPTCVKICRNGQTFLQFSREVFVDILDILDILESDPEISPYEGSFSDDDEWEEDDMDEDI